MKSSIRTLILRLPRVLYVCQRQWRRDIYAAMMKPEANGEIFNIGSTREITILDLAETIKRLSGTPGELKLKFVPYESFTGRKYEDVRRRVPDVSRCEQVLGVKAKVGLEAGLTRTIEWQRRAIRLRNQADAPLATPVYNLEPRGVYRA